MSFFAENWRKYWLSQNGNKILWRLTQFTSRRHCRWRYHESCIQMAKFHRWWKNFQNPFRACLSSAVSFSFTTETLMPGRRCRHRRRTMHVTLLFLWTYKHHVDGATNLILNFAGLCQDFFSNGISGKNDTKRRPLSTNLSTNLEFVVYRKRLQRLGLTSGHRNFILKISTDSLSYLFAQSNPYLRILLG